MSGQIARIKLTQTLMQTRKKLKPQLAEAAKKKKWNIYRGDTVQVISRRHPEYGKQGKVLALFRDIDRVVVDGVNLGERKIPANEETGTPESRQTVPLSMHYSNVNLVDPVTGLPTRVHRSFLPDGTKVRISKRSGAVIPRPDREPYTKTSRDPTESDTLEGDVWEVTYDKNAEVPPWERYEQMYGGGDEGGVSEFGIQK
eukprot:CAMPEP_0178520068 /NCGR_PEP_ID=MMETSP0696-20121128/27194_1 /TAXON_ID=265572 /ORGANISM="Extubocellulus spinifer, Strain CCMP396" /LENGTH=199 /DNA_ID=CAMNT_0020150875 /DNA_START=147 /DNA_END=746 /DNA_ORIENTATION=-